MSKDAVIVLQDHLLQGGVIREILSKSFQVEMVRERYQFFTLLSQRQFRLALVDLDLNDHDTMEILFDISRLKSPPPVLAITGNRQTLNKTPILKRLGVRSLLFKVQLKDLLMTHVRRILVRNEQPRQHPRVKVDFDVQYRQRGDRNLLRSKAVSFSSGGICLLAPNPSEVNSEFELQLTVPQTRSSIRLLAKVLYSTVTSRAAQQQNPHGIGLRFVGLTPEQDQYLQSLVAALQTASA